MTQPSKTIPASGTAKPLIFFGTEDFSVTALLGLIEAGFTIAAVVTKPDSRRGRGMTYQSPQVKLIAEEHGISVWQPVRLRDIIPNIKALSGAAGVLVSYGKIIPQSIIDLFDPGIINLHPSLLPLYRGPSPIETAIINGDRTTGVSIMRLEAAMDAGPVYAQTTVPLSGMETKADLSRRLAILGTAILIETLPAILSGNLTPTPQDDAEATYCHLLSKADSLLDPATLSAAAAERRVRAYQGFPKVKIAYGQHTVTILSAHVCEASSIYPFKQAFRDNTYLCVNTVIAPSGRTMTAAAFMRGYGDVGS